MPVNYDGRWEVRINYVSTVSGLALPHVMTLDFIPDPPSPLTVGTPPGSIDVFTKGGATDTLDNGVADLMAVVLPIHSENTEFTGYEVWQYGEEPSQDATFITGAAITSPGGQGTTPGAARQSIITLRTEGGGIMKCVNMESPITGDQKDPFPFSDAAFDALADYLLSSDSIWVGRDNTFPIFGLFNSKGQNEATWRKRFRP